MSQTSFTSLPDDARVWCFAVEPEPAPRQVERLLDAMQQFVGDWTAHRRDLTAGIAWIHHRFLLVGLDESRAGASGCSIDALMHRLSELEEELDVSLTDGASVWFRDADGIIRSASREEFGRLATAGRVDAATPVFDLTVPDAGGIRAGRLERPASETWHSRLL